ncbi:YccT family protein [Psychromonas ossibalaenae]|uniref:YccT family protein n=1 Tax=Psychromonas ossibalaenae TaxID=444922 RepID=UPI00036D592C|nr:DUF2057 domain-containing protein [Psychromonas ossibalaenae]
MKKFIAVSLLLLGSSNIWADSLTISKEFEFIAVNGEQVSSSLFNKINKVTLPVGLQKVAVQYIDTVRDDVGNGSTRVKSSPVIISLQVTAGDEYLLSPAEKISSLTKAKAFAKSPEVMITDQHGVSASYSQKLSVEVDHGVIGNIIDKHDNEVKGRALKETSTLTGKQNIAEEKLHHWWNEADETTRKQFADWAIKQTQ